MTETLLPHRPRLVERWPTALALVVIAGAVTAISFVDREANLFGPAIATMAGIYLVAYAIGRPWTAWLLPPITAAEVIAVTTAAFMLSIALPHVGILGRRRWSTNGDSTRRAEM